MCILRYVKVNDKSLQDIYVNYVLNEDDIHIRKSTVFFLKKGKKTELQNVSYILTKR